MIKPKKAVPRTDHQINKLIAVVRGITEEPCYWCGETFCYCCPECGKSILEGHDEACSYYDPRHLHN